MSPDIFSETYGQFNPEEGKPEGQEHREAAQWIVVADLKLE